MSRRTENREGFSEQDFRTIGMVNFGKSHYLIGENPTAKIRFNFINPAREGLRFHKETKELPEESILTFNNLDSGTVTVAQIGMTAPTIQWSEKTSGIEEPTVFVEGRNAMKFEKTSVKIFEKELHDLFIPEKDKDRKATFFTVDTTSHDLVGIALKRSSPVMMFLTPGSDGLHFTPQIGLQNFVNQMYEKLCDHLTTFQASVDQRVFDAMISDKDIEFTYDDSSAVKVRQKDIQKKIYQIQALLLAAKAEAKETGMQDPNLLAHAPFLAKATQQTKESGFFNRFKEEEEPTQPKVRIGNKIWENLVSGLSEDLLVDHEAQARRAAQSVRLVTPTPVYQMPTQPSPTVTIPETKTVPVVKDREQSPAKNATSEAYKLSTGINNATKLFKNLEIGEVNNTTVDLLGEHVGKTIQYAREYIRVRKPQTSEDDGASAKILVQPDKINVAGIKDHQAFEFLTGDVEGSYKAKIDSVFSAWESYVKPLFATLDESGQNYSSFRVNGEFRSKNPNIFRKLFIDAEKIRKSFEGKDFNLANTAHILLAEQLFYSLHAQYEQIKNANNDSAVDQWATYSFSVLAKFNQLLPNAQKEKSNS